jgi:hypothetical protein
MSAMAILKSKRKEDSGQALVEFALSALLFLLVVFAVMDFSYFFYVKLTLQNAVRQAGRYAITGQAMSGASRYNSILQTVENYSLGIAPAAEITICSASGGCGTAGGPSEAITITIAHPYKFITPSIAAFFKNGSYTITVSSSFNSEPFPP